MNKVETRSVYYGKYVVRSIAKKWLLAGRFDIHSSIRSRLETSHVDTKENVQRVPCPNILYSQ